MAKSGDIPAGLIETADKAELDWVATACEHDGYRRRRRFSCHWRRIAALRHEDGHAKAYEVCC